MEADPAAAQIIPHADGVTGATAIVAVRSATQIRVSTTIPVYARTRVQTAARRRRNALAMTDTELKLIAAAAIIGESNTPRNG